MARPMGKSVLDVPKTLRKTNVDPEFQTWSTPRQQLANLVESRKFDAIIGAVIAANCIVMILETDERASCADPESSACISGMILYTVFGNLFLAVYMVELGMKVYVYRLEFPQSSWNLFDLFIVALSLVSEVFGNLLPGISIARVFRAIRLAKVFRVLMVYKELYMIIFGFMSAMKAIIWASLLLFFLLTIWAIFAVELLHPVARDLAAEGAFEGTGCNRCGRAFSSVMESNLTFVQTIIF